jgi:benzodiazapine receptor
MTRRSEQVLGLALWLVLTSGAAAIGAAGSARADNFYNELHRPAWAPPASAFGPVWSLLYLMMGVAAWLAWRKRQFWQAKPAFWLFLTQLVANALWSWLFFAWHRGGLAFAEILVLWGLLFLTLACFWKISRLAGALLIPYLLWVTYAAALCFKIWKMNPDLLGSALF